MVVLRTDTLDEGISLSCSDTFYYFPYFVLEKVEFKYVPFESPEEFMKAYGDHTHPDKDSEINNALPGSGMWLINTRKERPAVEQVIAVRDKSVSFRKSICTYAGLLEFFTFPDGTPCGKLREESNA